MQQQIKWPKGLGDFFCSEQTESHPNAFRPPALPADGGDDDASSPKRPAQLAMSADEGTDGSSQLTSAESVTRPDSGVGESVSAQNYLQNI